MAAFISAARISGVAGVLEVWGVSWRFQGTVLGYTAFAGAMAGAVFLLFNNKPIESLGTFIVAIGSAFGPKIYADFIQPKNPQPPAPTP
jgi:hypothetical protein